MKQMEKEIRNYLAAVRRNLNLPRQLRQRCISDLQTTIQARLESGENWAQIQHSMGAPKAVAAELREQFGEFVYRKSPWRYVCLAVAVGCGLWLAWYLGVTWFARLLAGQAASLGVIGGADGPTAIFVTSNPGFDWDLVIMGALVVAGVAGYWRLCRCKPKK